jgi:hypothetical protein
MASLMPRSRRYTLPHTSPASFAIRTWLTQRSFENTSKYALAFRTGSEGVQDCCLRSNDRETVERFSREHDPSKN